ncbi:MAG TPA: hypothetical protein VF272_02535 [Candidatus Saccharimonadia bacterium]
MDDITKAYSWKDSLELSKQLVQLCERFSDVDTNVLVWHLRQAVVDIPATVAADLQANRPANLDPSIKLMAELELVHKIYPGIDTGSTEELLRNLLERMRSDRFGERESEHEDHHSEESDEHSEHEEHHEDHHQNHRETHHHIPEVASLKVDSVGSQPVISIDPTQPSSRHNEG